MSTLVCPIVHVDKWARHPNADTLGVAHVLGNCVIFRIADFLKPIPPEKDPLIWGIQIGDAIYQKGTFNAVFIPEEALLPEDPRWAFLWANRAKEGKTIREIDRVVKALKLRGIFSCGLLVPVPVACPECGGYSELYKMITTNPPICPVCYGTQSPIISRDVGTDMAELWGITKFEKPEQVGSGGDNVSGPPWFQKYTEIENARGLVDRSTSQARHTIFEGYNVVITEKIHGANTRYTYWEDKFWVGSHANTKALDSVNWWTRAAKLQGIEEICKKNQGLLLFGEVCGPVQKGYPYGQKVPYFVLFDIYDYKAEEPYWYSWDDVRRFCDYTGVLEVPELYRGPWVSLEHAASFADGPSQFPGADHNREGCVVKADPEIYNPYVGRGILKIVGEEYLLRKYKV